MHLHILGICGTFMAGMAILAKELGFTVTGSDQNIYPPMSTQLKNHNIPLFEGYDDLKTPLASNVIVIGNVMCRGMPIIEYLLENKMPLISGPEWLAQNVLKQRHVLAVAGTHGKTTTASMLTWILEYAGLKPGFLIGGLPNNFGISARLGEGSYFVLEADEYDSAFFDKRSKFIHYRPNTLIINNLEFDHADIFSDLQAIQQQFHHLIRMMPNSGLIIHPKEDKHIKTVLDMGCWTPNITIHADENKQGWSASAKNASCDVFEIYLFDRLIGQIDWELLGKHNMNNAMAAIAAAYHINIDPKIAIKALCQFQGVKRRLEMKKSENDITVYDDFAHHPTAIQTTLSGLKAKVKDKRIIAVIDICSNTMKKGIHKEVLAKSFDHAAEVYFYHSRDVLWNVLEVWNNIGKKGGAFLDSHLLLDALLKSIQPDDHIIFMSNGGFSNIQTLFMQALAKKN